MKINYNKDFYKSGAFYDAALETALGALSLGRYKNANEILADTPESTGYGAGFTYNKMGSANIGLINKEYTGNALSSGLSTTFNAAKLGNSIVPGFGAIAGGVVGLGASIAGFFGGKSKLQRELEEYAQRAIAYNTSSHAKGMTEWLQLNEAYHGKDFGKVFPKYSGGKDVVHTAFGKAYGIPNGWGNYGEPMIENADDPRTSTASVIDTGAGKKDAAPIYAKPDTVILGNDINPYTQNTFAKDGEADARKIQVLNNQIELTRSRFATKSNHNNKFRGVVGKNTDRVQNINVEKAIATLVLAKEGPTKRLQWLGGVQKAVHNMLRDLMKKYYNFNPTEYMRRYETGKDDEGKLAVKPFPLSGIVNPVELDVSSYDGYRPYRVTKKENDNGSQKTPFDLLLKYAFASHIPKMLYGALGLIRSLFQKPRYINKKIDDAMSRNAVIDSGRMKINMNSLIRNAYNTYRMSAYNILLNGGYTPAQRQSLAVANQGQLLDAIEKADLQRQLHGLQLRKDANDLAAKVGPSIADRDMRMFMYNNEDNARSHAAANMMPQVHARTYLDANSEMYGDLSKYRMFADIINRYHLQNP